MLGLPSWAGRCAITADTVVFTLAILTRRPHRSSQLGERRQLDPGLLERLADRPRDRGCVGRVAVDADALDLELEVVAVDGQHLSVTNEAHRLLTHLVRVAELLDALEHEPAVRVVV